MLTIERSHRTLISRLNAINFAYGKASNPPAYGLFEYEEYTESSYELRTIEFLVIF
jgi:hypothetical protein